MLLRFCVEIKRNLRKERKAESEVLSDQTHCLCAWSVHGESQGEEALYLTYLSSFSWPS